MDTNYIYRQIRHLQRQQMLIPIDKMLLYKISRSIDNFLLRILELVSSPI
jgi:hypothetical protein